MPAILSNLRFLLNLCFLIPPILTMMLLCITLYTYWTLAEYLKIASSFEFGLELNTAREIGKLKMDWSRHIQDFDECKCN